MKKIALISAILTAAVLFCSCSGNGAEPSGQASSIPTVEEKIGITAEMTADMASFGVTAENETLIFALSRTDCTEFVVMTFSDGGETRGSVRSIKYYYDDGVYSSAASASGAASSDAQLRKIVTEGEWLADGGYDENYAAAEDIGFIIK